MALLNKVHIKKPRFSNFDLSRKNRTTMAPGVLYPLLVEELLPGDSIDLSMKSLIKTYPTLAPLMGSYKLQLDLFFVPSRLYCPELRLNSPNFDPTIVKFPTLHINPFIYSSGSNGGEMHEDGTFYQTQRSLSSNHLLNFLGMPTGYARYSLGLQFGETTINAIPFLGYYDIFRNYYCNTQELDYYAFDGSVDTVTSDNSDNYNVYSTKTSLECFALSRLNEYFDKQKYLTISHKINDPGEELLYYCLPNFVYNATTDQYDNVLSTELGGLCLRTFSADVNNTWLDTITYDQMITKARVNTDGDYFTIDQLRMGNKVMKYLERTLVSGGRFGDFIEAQFGVNTDYKLDIPEFLGSTSTDIIFDDVVQTSGYDSETLGSLGGRGKGFLESRKHHFRSTENGYLMVIGSLCPRPDYYQGVKPYLTKTNFCECFAPALDNLGFQTTPVSNLSALPELSSSRGGDGKIGVRYCIEPASPFLKSVGYQPAWQEYMTATNELHGDFTTTLSYWALGRDFTSSNKEFSTFEGINDYVYEDPCTPTAYVLPTQFNSVFADSSSTAENFLCQFAFDFFAKRNISKQIMPNL